LAAGQHNGGGNPPMAQSGWLYYACKRGIRWHLNHETPRALRQQPASRHATDGAAPNERTNCVHLIAPGEDSRHQFKVNITNGTLWRQTWWRFRTATAGAHAHWHCPTTDHAGIISKRCAPYLISLFPMRQASTCGSPISPDD